MQRAVQQYSKFDFRAFRRAPTALRKMRHPHSSGEPTRNRSGTVRRRKPRPVPRCRTASALVADKIAAYGDDPDFVTALARGLGVLLALSDKKRRMTIAQVSHRTGIPRAAARRSLHTLEKLGFVAADDARRFYLRPRVLSFSHGYLSASPIAVLAQPILDRLSESLREACSLAMLDGDEIVYIARSSSSRIMSPCPQCRASPPGLLHVDRARHACALAARPVERITWRTRGSILIRITPLPRPSSCCRCWPRFANRDSRSRAS